MDALQHEPAMVPGFRFSAIGCGIKRPDDPRLDLGLIVCDRPAAAAAVFTQNRVKAAPVVLSAERIGKGSCQAIIVNSGNANACTGPAGMRDARSMTEAVARATGIDEELVCVASTGVIGQRMPMERVLDKVPGLAKGLRAESQGDFSRAILTTDKGPKVSVGRATVAGKAITVAGVAKGAGMIAPNMATTLSFLVTDAAVDRLFLRTLLREEIEDTLNSVTVDGDTSTNDSCFLLASGAAQNPLLREDDRNGRAFRELTRSVLLDLGRQLVRDGEGATRLVEVEVTGAAYPRDARAIARRIANSPLVKTAIGGADPNWGRILAAAGAAGVELDPERIEVELDDVRLVRAGQFAGGDAEERAHAVMKRSEYRIRVDLRAGRERASCWTCDLSHEYVTINADYRS